MGGDHSKYSLEITEWTNKYNLLKKSSEKGEHTWKDTVKKLEKEIMSLKV